LDEISKASAVKTSSIDPALIQRWINHWAFEARVTAAGIPLANYEYIMADTLDTKAPSPMTKQFDANVTAVCQWFIYAGKYLHKEQPAKWADRAEKVKTLEGNEKLSEEARDACRKAQVAMGKAERAKK
jgi:Protein of unknown function (DUF3632)